MFDNILEQDRFCERISRDIRVGSLPPSILFSGPRFSGKLTAALETARVLSCRNKGAPWNCLCKSCQASRLLLQPQLLMLGRRSFSEDIGASMALLKREDTAPARYMFIRSVRKLLRRFDPVIWEGEEKKISKGAKGMGEINDFLIALEPGRNSLAPKEMKEGFSLIAKNAGDLEKLIPATIPIGQIRRISSWSHRASGGVDSTKVVMMDRAETMGESSRNALLKLLEEPPENLYLIMMTERKRMILPTILSRVRNYSLNGRGTAVSRSIVKRLYREDLEGFSLEDYFGRFRSSGEAAFADLAQSYLEDLCRRESVFPSRIFDGMDEAGFADFFHELFRTLRIWQRRSIKGEGTLPLPVMEEWNRLLREGYSAVETYNQNPLLILESLYYKMREM